MSLSEDCSRAASTKTEVVQATPKTLSSDFQYLQFGALASSIIRSLRSSFARHPAPRGGARHWHTSRAHAPSAAMLQELGAERTVHPAVGRVQVRGRVEGRVIREVGFDR